jgi:hypothetical protein
VVVKTSGTAQAPIRFAAAPGEQVVMTGADRLTGWRRADAAQPIYSVAWTSRFVAWNPTMAHPGDEYHRLIGRCEQVAVDGCLLRQVLSPSQLAPGSFLADVTNQTLLVWDSAGRDVNKAQVEAAVRQETLRVEGDHVQVRGLRFRQAANMAQRGAVVLAGNHDLLEDCVVEAMNACGAGFAGEGAVVRRCVFRDNGQLGFGASRAHGLLFTECLVENNNTKGYDRQWEAGGNKLALCRGVVIERSRFIRNRGNGIWFDIGNTACTVRQCLIADNEDAGIFYEISFSLLACDNVIIGNGFASTAGAWGAQAGISLSSSPGCLVERNLIVANREGFSFREQARATPTIENRESRPVWNHDQFIRHNVIAFNRDAQVWGWFDVDDNRHWPAGSQPTSQPSLTAATDGVGGADSSGPRRGAGQPGRLTLEDLRLSFHRNVYYAAPGNGWFKWGPTWSRHRSYASLDEFRSDLGIDAESKVLEPSFANLGALDFRLDPEGLAQIGKSYPRGTVPGVLLGPSQP